MIEVASARTRRRRRANGQTGRNGGASGELLAVAARRTPSPRTRAAVLPFPRRAALSPLALRSLAPSPRSFLAGLALLAIAGAGYLGARETSVFAVRDIRVQGATGSVAADVRRALAPIGGSSLVALSPAALDRRLAPLAYVVSADYDRAYPNTLVVTVTLERPLLVVRRGSESWLVSARGRVLAELPRGARPALPRLWVSRSTELGVGALSESPEILRALGVLRPLAEMRFPARVGSVRAGDELALRLRSGVEVRLGESDQLPLKLAVARRVLPLLGADSRYLDVSIPERAVAGTNPQVEGRG